MSNSLVIVFHADVNDREEKIKNALKDKRIIIEDGKIVEIESNTLIAEKDQIKGEQNYKFAVVYDDYLKNLPKEKIALLGKNVQKIFVACHSKNIMDDQKKDLNTLFPDKCMFSEYSHSQGNIIYENSAKLISASNSSEFANALKKIIDEINGDNKKKRNACILKRFLPLEIDMQALAEEKVDKEKYLQEMAKDIDELYSSEKKKKTHYRRKLYDLWYLLGQKEWHKKRKLEYSPELEEFTPIETSASELCELADVNNGKPDVPFSIRNFLNMLDTNTIENKVKEICKLNITVPGKENNKTKEINLFHKWYCKLGEYLKEHEV